MPTATDDMSEPSPLDKLLRWDRGFLWDYVCAVSGLNSLNLINAANLVDRTPFTYGGDFQYNLFLGTVLRAEQRLKHTSVGLGQEAQRILVDLGIKGSQVQRLATHYGHLSNYAWHSTPVEGGANFTPIYYRVAALEQKYPADQQRLKAIVRRLAYLETLADELRYTLKTYDFDAIPKLQDWVAAKVETLTSLAAEISLVVTEFYLEKNGTPRRVRFEEMLDVLSGVRRVFSSIDSSLEGYLIVSLRNEMVHSAGSYLELVQGSPRMSVELSKKLLSFGCLQGYLTSDVLSGQHASMDGTVSRGGEVYFAYSDPRFPYVSFLFRRSKKGSPSLDGAIARYNVELGKFADLALSFVYLLSRELLNLV